MREGGTRGEQREEEKKKAERPAVCVNHGHGKETPFRLSGTVTRDFGVRMVTRSAASAGGFSERSIFTILESRPPEEPRLGARSSLPSALTTSIEMKDPEGKIISVDVVKADGSELHAPSRGSSGGRDSKMVKIDLAEKPPADAALLVTLRTAKSLVTVPLNLKGVSLP